MVALTRRRAISSSRDELFRDLDEAETIVLALLKCASEVSESLSKMTTAKSRQQDDKEDGNTMANGGESFEQLATQVRSNGVGYLAGVNKLHKLLSPHAELVKSYRNHSATAALNGNSNLEGAASSSIETTNANVQQQQATQQSSSGITSFDPNSSEIIRMATCSMYAARVEKRLAEERREILKEMIRLEEEEEKAECGGKEEEEEARAHKRKR